MAYAELHAHSNFSFLDGASHPEELAAVAVQLGLAGLALTDHNGFYGVVRFAEGGGGRPSAPGWPIRTGPIWWCWPVIPRGTPDSAG